MAADLVDYRAKSALSEAEFFDSVGYSTVWEDERIVADGLRPRPGGKVVSVTSGADFSLQFLLSGCDVLSVDFNARQNHLLELKMAAVGTLDHPALWRFVGLTSDPGRAHTYRDLREQLSPEARRYWDAQPQALTKGILFCGRQDRYLRLCGRAVRALQGGRLVDDLFACRSLPEQRELVARRWHNWRWRTLTGLLFNRFVMNRAYDRAHFRYAVDRQNTPREVEATVMRILGDVPIWTNFYLHLIVYGTYPDTETCPAWLRRSNFETLRSNLPRLQIVTAQLEQVLTTQTDASIDRFNFSNIFDWMSEEAFLDLMRQVVRCARPQARLCYWTNVMIKERKLDPVLAQLPRLRSDAELAAALFDASRTPGYSACTLGYLDEPSPTRSDPGG